MTRIAFLVFLAAGVLVWEYYRLRSSVSRTREEPTTTASWHCANDSPEVTLPRRTDGLTDVTDEVGLNFEHVVGPLGTYFMPESIGAGGALADLDGDGRLDIYLVNSGPSPGTHADLPVGTSYQNRYFRQNESGQFVDMTDASGLGDRGYGAGCAVGDVDNDGDLDVYITNYRQDRLYLNAGDGTFVDSTDAAGIRESDWGTCAAWFDYDRDGWLDLIVVNYTFDPKYDHSVACGFPAGLVSYCGPKKFEPTVDRLYHNDGPQSNDDGRTIVRFTDVTVSVGLAQSRTYGFGVVCADFDRDGWADIFIANDGDRNRLWMNQRDGTFADEAVQRGVAVNQYGAPEAGMGVACGDVNADGSLDLVVTHLSTETTTLYQSQAGGAFTDATGEAGLANPTRIHTGWGAALLDLDLDGNLDLPMVSGLVVPCHSGFPFHGEEQLQVRHDKIEDSAAFWREYADTNLLLMGKEDSRFEDGASRSGDFCSPVASARSLIYGDIDNDGDVDLLVTNCGSRARLYRNDMPKRGHWLTIQPVDPTRRRDAVGAEVTVVVGERRFHQAATPGSSYLASNDSRVHFGLGAFDHVDEIVVRWPDGPPEKSIEIFAGGSVDRFLTVRRGDGVQKRESD